MKDGTKERRNKKSILVCVLAIKTHVYAIIYNTHIIYIVEIGGSNVIYIIIHPRDEF